ncbi:exopolysaccharide biosynthesis protein [Rubellimicrobium sp. CFH 75288]|uniref:exopolysaccharide biosynthesis protein n=1 Tax=Rubellimicrobium sp. CFH 75288 TaxID=2697034 RepID=UPI0014120875|nr:exopolysaccharide biosynthesis protein [Rubellimicrobium sp. CFH 75288]NAZ37215.1 exopolysaccharide biosynthesis protein [Rubellimicrobium sp. CFH 75288]
MRNDDPGRAARPVARPVPRVRIRGRLLRRRGIEPKKLSVILTELATDETRERVALADILRAMHERAFGALLLVFAFPNALPAIPGTSTILGLPVLFLALQMMLGRKPWLPRSIALRSMARGDFANLVERVNPWLEWADRFTAPRLQFLVTPRAERLLGAYLLLLGIVLTLPIPFGNMLPAIGIVLIALGVLERDGLWILAGIVVGLVAFAVVAGVLWAVLGVGTFLWLNAF